MNKLSFGILDFCSSPHLTIELASRVENLGYSRYWLAEHHPGKASGSPELLIPIIAALTKKMRVGIAGVLLYFYSPLKVAENFYLLENLFSERIDLGVCRGIAEPSIAQALLDGRTRNLNFDLYQEKVEQLLAHLYGNSHLVQPLPVSANTPEVWVLGSGSRSAPLAACYGVGYSHSLFHKGCLEDPCVIQEYRKTFQPHTEKIPVPLCNLAVAGICADTEAQAYRLLEQHDNEFVVPKIVGSPSQCRKKLQELQEHYKVDEIIFLDLCQQFKDHLHSYELLAAELDLNNITVQQNKMVQSFTT